MKDLAFDHFPRQYPDDQVTIGIDESKIPIFRIHKRRKHLPFFSKCIRNAKVFSAENDNLRCLFDFLHTECCVDLRTLQLNIPGRLKADDVEVIRSRLKNLSTLSIYHPYRRCDIHDVLLKYCENLEHFEILSKSSFGASWMLYKYPTLQSLSILVDTEEQIL